MCAINPSKKVSSIEHKMLDYISGNSKQSHKVRRESALVANTNSNVLLLGESGTGKEVIAKAIHYCSDRKDKPFVAINCGAIPSELLESELFGHNKGAFTGAFNNRIGRFELAQDGTVFLDEIGDMPHELQVKLLRVIQERTFVRVGGDSDIQFKARIIAATHKNLPELVNTGKFREDLFYRLNVFPIDVPPLRERDDDIPILMKSLMIQNGWPLNFSNEAKLAFQSYEWPGNIRELQNIMERLFILHSTSTITADDLPTKIRGDHTESPLDDQDFLSGIFDSVSDDQFEASLSEQEKLEASFFDMSDEQPSLCNVITSIDNLADDSHIPPGLCIKSIWNQFERKLITIALSQAGGNITDACKLLNLKRTTFHEKAKKLDVLVR